MKTYRTVLSVGDVLGLLGGLRVLYRPVTLSSFGPSTTAGYDWTFRYAYGLWNDVSTALLLEKFAPCRVGDPFIGRETCRIWQVPMTMGDVAVEYRADSRMVEHRGFHASIGTAYVDFGHELIEYTQEHARWRSAVSMPDAASRFHFTVSDVAVEKFDDAYNWRITLTETP